MLSVLLGEPITNIHDKVISYYNDQCSGLDIKASYVFSVCPGKVVSIGRNSNGTAAVSVLVNNTQMLRYSNLGSVYVSENQMVSFRTEIGHSNKFVRFEYCMPSPKSKWPVRVGQLVMYKQDPQPLLTGESKLIVRFDNIKIADADAPDIYIDNPLMRDELSNNRGEE